MSIRGTVLISLFIVLGLFLLATGWLARQGMEQFQHQVASQLHAELLEEGTTGFVESARALFRAYEALPPEQRAADPVATLQPYIPEEDTDTYLFFDAAGNPRGPSPVPDYVTALVSPAMLQAFLAEAAAEDKRQLTIDNYGEFLAGRLDQPAIIHLQAYPDDDLILGKARVQYGKEIRATSISEVAAAAMERLARQGGGVALALIAVTLGLVWLILQYTFFRPLGRTFALAGEQSTRTNLSWAQFREYAGRLREMTAEKESVRAKLEHEIEARFQAEEERDKLRNQMDHALHKFEAEIQHQYAEQLQEAGSALMRREARALHHHLLEPLAQARNAVAERPGDDPARSAIDACLATVRGLVDEQFELPYAPTLTPVSDWLHEVVTQFSEKHAIPVHTNISNGAKVKIDPGSFRQAIEFIMENAAQASRSEAPINVDTAVTEEGVEIRIVDRGAGIPSEARPHILVPFYTLDETADGLGLAITRAVIRQHGGQLRIQSESDKGTAVIVTLPLAGN